MASDLLRNSRDSTLAGVLAPDSVPEGFTPAQLLAMGALLSGKTVTAAARAAGVSRASVHNWLADDPRFLAFYNEARREMSDAIQQSVRLLSATALVTLRRMLTRRSVPDAVKLKAATVVLGLANRPVEGPTDPEDAANLIGKRDRVRGIDRTCARREGAPRLTRDGLLHRLDRPVDAEDLDGIDDDDDEELDDEEELGEDDLD